MRHYNTVGIIKTQESFYYSKALQISDKETSSLPALTSCCSDSCPEFSSSIFTKREVPSFNSNTATFQVLGHLPATPQKFQMLQLSVTF